MNVTIDATQVHFTKTSPTHACIELSDITRFSYPDTITIRKRAKEWVFRHTGTKRDSEGEAEEFTYRCRTDDGKEYSLTVFND